MSRRGQFKYNHSNFFNAVDKSGGEDSCWRWTGCIDRQSGYGKVSFLGDRNQLPQELPILSILETSRMACGFFINVIIVPAVIQAICFLGQAKTI